MNKKTASVSQGVGPVAIRSHPVNGILQYLEQAMALALCVEASIMAEGLQAAC